MYQQNPLESEKFDIDGWMKSLGKDTQKKAEKLFGHINKIKVSPDEKKNLFKNSVLTFEHLRCKDTLDKLETVIPENIEVITDLFSDLDDIEATWYYQVVNERLNVINKLMVLTNKNDQEKVIQKHIFDHLWLVDASWERATDTPVMEQSVSAAFSDINVKLSKEEKNGRLDIRYKMTSGKHVIIELKRPERVVSTFELIEQIDKYRNALKKILNKSNKNNEPVEVVCVLGKEPKDWNNPDGQKESIDMLKAKDARIVFYYSLIDSAQKSYQNFLDKQKDKGRILDVLNGIDSGF